MKRKATIKITAVPDNTHQFSIELVDSTKHNAIPLASGKLTVTFASDLDGQKLYNVSLGQVQVGVIAHGQSVIVTPTIVNSHDVKWLSFVKLQVWLLEAFILAESQPVSIL